MESSSHASSGGVKETHLERTDRSRKDKYIMHLPSTLRTTVSPPRRRTLEPNEDGKKTIQQISDITKDVSQSSTEARDLSLAAIEAGDVQVNDHLSIFASRLLKATRPVQPGVPRLSHSNWVDLYLRNQHPKGRHFVIHQHDHPVAGPHYDLRLQISETSSVSWAIMYGLPGDPNSRRLNRNATETRVHCLWVSRVYIALCLFPK